MPLIDLLRLPEATRDCGDPGAVSVHDRIIRRKRFLRRLYSEWYHTLGDSVCADGPGGVVLELGSGAGFIKSVIPHAVTSDVMAFDGLDLCCSALELPFEDGAVDAIVMIDVLHHLPDAAVFFRELGRCLRPGARVAMVEPANTPWSRFIWQRFHHEPFEPNSGWELDGSGPGASANGAIPWIVFVRDRKRFENEFGYLKLRSLRHHTSLRYLLSGGLSIRQLVPSWSFAALTGFERLLAPISPLVGMFFTIELERVGE